MSAAGTAATQAAPTRGTAEAARPSAEPGTTTATTPMPTIAAMAAPPPSTTTMPMAATTAAEARLGLGHGHGDGLRDRSDGGDAAVELRSARMRRSWGSTTMSAARPGSGHTPATTGSTTRWSPLRDSLYSDRAVGSCMRRKPARLRWRQMRARAPSSTMVSGWWTTMRRASPRSPMPTTPSGTMRRRNPRRAPAVSSAVEH